MVTSLVLIVLAFMVMLVAITFVQSVIKIISQNQRVVRVEYETRSKSFYSEMLSSSCTSESESSTIVDIISLSATNSTATSEKERKRCKSCNKKIGLLGFQCRCGDVFCGTHRYPEIIACKIDFKKIGREVLIKQNLACVGDKLKDRV